MSGLIGLAEAARSFGRTGRGGTGVHPATLTRWILCGVLTPAGRVKLRAVRVGSKWATRGEWLEEFIGATTAAHVPAAPVPVRSPAERDRASARAAAELAGIGV